MDIPITFASDAHAPEQIGFKYEEAVSTAKAIGYTKAATFKKREKELVIF
jgi:histidinol-phosphatase (PHP family)